MLVSSQEVQVGLWSFSVQNMGKFGMKTMEEEWLWLQSEEAAPYREEFAERSDLMFPDKGGMRRGTISIGRRLAKGGFYLKEDALGLMNTIHPAAFKLLATYGVYYMPFTLTKALPEPERNRCFANSRVLALTNAHLCYVEGIVIGVLVCPMLHAWNAGGRNGTIAVDWTQYSICRWSRYLGIPLTLDEHSRVRRAARIGTRSAPIFNRKFFTPRVERVLLSILKKRRRHWF